MKTTTSIKFKFRFNNIALNRLKNQDGASAILVVIVVAMLLGFTALAIDVGYMYSTRNELQNVADAAALAGAGELGQIYLGLDYVEQQNFNVDEIGETYRTDIQAAVENTAVQNRAAGDPISINTADIAIGIWDWTSTNLATALNTTTSLRPDAVRVIARRDATMNNAVSTLFGFIFSFFGSSANTFEVSAVATAALSGASIVEEGVLKAPFAISENSTCPNVIQFSPTTSSCAGWHNFFDPINANAVTDKMIGLIEGFDGSTGTEGHDWLDTNYDITGTPTAEVTPEAGIGNSFEFQGGVIAALFASGGYYDDWSRPGTPPPATIPVGTVQDNEKKPIPFINLFDFYRFRDGDGSGSDMVNVCGTPMLADKVWTATVPVYKENGVGCTNPTGSIEIVGFAYVRIIMPNPPPDNTIDVCLDCNYIVEPGRGGGGTSGNVMGTIPNLVQ